MLGLTASVAAFADPFVPNNTAPSVIGPPASGEQSLQTIADNLFMRPVNLSTEQSSAAFFTFATSSTTSIPTLIAEFTVNNNSQSFGIWFGTDTNTLRTVDLLLGPAQAGDNAAISFSGSTLNVGSTAASACMSGRVNCGTFTDSLITASSFGFYFRPFGSSGSSPLTYYTLDQLNSGARKDRVVGIQDGMTTNWLFAYEDGTDFD